MSKPMNEAPANTVLPMNTKEGSRKVVAYLAVAIVVALLCYVPLGPRKQYLASRGAVNQARAQRDLALKTQSEEANRLKQQATLIEQLNARDKNFELWSFLNRVLTESNLKDRANLQEVKPRTREEKLGEAATLVQLKLRGVKMMELIDLLHKIYNSKNLVVLYGLDSLKPSQDVKGLDCDVTFLSPKVVTQ